MLDLTILEITHISLDITTNSERLCDKVYSSGLLHMNIQEVESKIGIEGVRAM